MKLFYNRPTITKSEFEPSPLFSQYLTQVFSNATSISTCAGASLSEGSSCGQGGLDDVDPIVFLFCVQGVETNNELIGGVRVVATCDDGTLDLEFPACSLATALVTAELCPTGGLAVTCFKDFDCNDVPACDNGPNSIDVIAANGDVHTCESVVDLGSGPN